MVFDAIQLMADKNVGALSVLDNGQLVGMISERDYTRKVHPEGQVVERHSCPGNHDARGGHRP